MFKRCKAVKTYSTEEAMGGTWRMLREDDGTKEWQVVEGEIEDDWD